MIRKNKILNIKIKMKIFYKIIKINKIISKDKKWLLIKINTKKQLLSPQSDKKINNKLLTHKKNCE